VFSSAIAFNFSTDGRRGALQLSGKSTRQTPSCLTSAILGNTGRETQVHATAAFGQKQKSVFPNKKVSASANFYLDAYERKGNVFG
jgi:hypothetical protein